MDIGGGIQATTCYVAECSTSLYLSCCGCKLKVGTTARFQYGVGQGSVLTAEGMDYHGDQTGSAFDSSLMESWRQHDLFKCTVIPSTWCLRLPALTMFGWERLIPCTAIEILAAGFWTGGLAAACTGSFYLMFMVSSNILILRRECEFTEKLQSFLNMISHFVFVCHLQAEGSKNRKKHHGSFSH